MRMKKEQWNELEEELRQFSNDNFIELDGELKHMHAMAESQLLEMTCQPVNETGLWPYK
jgi:hypothetical protein